MNTTLSIDQIWKLLQSIPDPEVPAISIVELGVVRNVEFEEGGVLITMTPTYSGCPALKAMEDDIRSTLAKEGIHSVKVKMVYKPAWTTDWLSEETKAKLEAYGIAPPVGRSSDQLLPFSTLKSEVHCPFCKSASTKLTSQFGSTACKALYYCDSCHQPFEHFKCH
jgi:ring-1,2-phenylacetyl-CoA epoxidase subunit PaaD